MRTMYTREQQALDEYITGHWGEDNNGPDPADQAHDLVSATDRLIHELEDNNDDGEQTDVIKALMEARIFLARAHDMML
jgi:hypothetical protein